MRERKGQMSVSANVSHSLRCSYNAHLTVYTIQRACNFTILGFSNNLSTAVIIGLKWGESFH